MLRRHLGPVLQTTLVLAALLVGAPSQATPLTSLQMLQQFNLVTLGNATINSHVDGRTYIGGNLSGNGAVFGMHPDTMPGSGYAALTVAGGVASGLQVTAGGATVLGSLSNSAINNGPTVVGGNASNSNFNGSGGSYVYGSKSGVNTNSGSLTKAKADAALATATSSNFASALTSTSQQLSHLASTGSWWTVSGGRVTFHAVAGADGIAVFDLTAVDSVLLAMSEFEFDLGSATAAILNSDIATASIKANFIGGGAQTYGSKLLWNFYDASVLNLNSQFGGSVLATSATLTNSNNIEGGVFVSQLVQNGEIHQQAYAGSLPSASPPSTGVVPEPGSLPLVLSAGLALIAVARRRANTL